MDRARIDPLVPPPAPFEERHRSRIIDVSTPDGRAFGLDGYSGAAPGEEAALWGPLHQYFLRIRLAGQDPEPALGTLLARWEEKVRSALAGAPDTLHGALADADTSLSVTVPARDVRYVRPLLAAHFAPVTNLSVRLNPAGTQSAAEVSSGGSGLGRGTLVRPAAARDAAAIAAIAAGLHHYDSSFGAVTARPGSSVRLAAGVSAAFGNDANGLWVLEQAGSLRGFAQLQSPGQAEWIQPLTPHPGHTGYLASLFVDPQTRGTGLGTALARAVLRETDRTGLPATVLHHAVANPLSGTFWSRQGYRPLFTIWQRRPAFRG